MSKVRIYGDTSGYVDIAVPAVAGTTTLNLDKIPQADISGNIAMDTDTLFVDAQNNKIGVSTTTPADKLEIQGSGADGIRLSVSGQSYYHKIRSNGDGLLLSADDSDAGGSGADIRFNVANSEKMRLNHDGNVMIGTTTAGLANNGDQLTVSDSGNTGITIRSTNSGQNNIYFSDGTTGSEQYIGYITYQHDVNALRFGANDNEAMRILSTGTILAHKTSSDGALTGFEARTSGQVMATIASATNEAVMYITQTGGGGNNGDDQGLVVKTQGTNAASGTGNVLRIAANNSTHGTFDNILVAKNNGNIGIGTSSPDVKLDVGNSDSGSAGVAGIQIQNSQDFSTVYDGTNVGTFAGIQTVNHDDTSNRTGTGIVFVHRSSSSGIAAIQSTSNNGDRADLRFITRGAGGIAEKMRIDNDGLVGIGSSAPNAPLNIVHTALASEPFCAMRIKNTSSSGYYYTGIEVDAVGQSHFRYALNGSLKWQTRVGLGNGTDKWSIYSWAHGDDMFVIDNTGRMHAKSLSLSASPDTPPTSGLYSSGDGIIISAGSGVGFSGGAGVGTHLEMGTNSDAGWASQYVQRYNYGGGGANDDRMFQFTVNGSAQGHIRSTTSGTTYQGSSDYRIKKNVVNLTDTDGIIKQLRPVKFEMTTEEGTDFDGVKHVGFLAHEVQEAGVTDCVSGTKDQVDEDGDPVIQGMDYGRLTPYLVKSLQDALNKIDELETRIKTLES